MPVLMPCPDAHELERYLLGLTPDPEASRLDDHVGSCEQCAQAAATLSGSDELIDAVRNAPERLRRLPRDEAAQQLIAQLKRLPCLVDDATVAFSSPAGDQEATQEFFDLLTPPQAPGELGRLGPFRILRMIGAGGMGVVFEAEDPHLGRRVAVKAMRRSLATSAPARARFLREARSVAALEHDHIVTVLQAGEDQGVLFLAMPLLKGESLDDRLKREGRLAPAEALRIAREAAEGLATAHERGLVHRDIKPANIWLESGSGRVKLLDFGLAKAMDEAADLTHHGAITGTPQYMSPEQTRGGAVTPRSDLFSLGCVLYQMLTGVAPFRGPDPIATLMAVATEHPASPAKAAPGVPRAVSELVLRLLAKAPEDRHESARAVVEAIQSTERALLTPGAPRRLRRVGLMLAGALALAALAGQVIYLSTGEGKIIVRVDPSDARVTVDGEPREGVTITVRSGMHTVKVEKQGFAPFRAEVRIWRGSETEVPASLKPAERARGGAAVGTATATRGQYDEQFPGFVPAPTPVPGIHRWQVAGRFPGGRFTDLAWSPDGTKLVVCGSDQIIRIYDAETLSLLRAWPFAHVLSVAWSGDGRWIAAGASTEAVGFWNAADGTPRPGLLPIGHGASVGALDFSPDGRMLAVAANSTQLRLWDVARHAPGPVLPHPEEILDVAWSPDGSLVATACKDRLVRVWDVARAEVSHTLKGHEGSIASVAFNDDGTRLVSVAADARVRVWNILHDREERSWELRVHANAHSYSVAVSKHGLAAFVSYYDPVIYLRDIADGTPGPACGGLPTQYHGPHALRFRPDGSLLASVSEFDALCLWDTKTGSLVRSVSSHSPEIVALARDPSGQTLVGAGHTVDAARLWDAATGTLRRVLPIRPSRSLRGVAFSPDGRTLALGCGAQRPLLESDPTDNAIRLFGADGTPGRVFTNLPSAIGALGFLPDGRRLVARSNGNRVQIWDVQTGALLRSAGPSGGPARLAIRPDGKRIAALDWSSPSLHLWDPETGAEGPVVEQGETPWIGEVVWSSDSRSFATAESGAGFDGIRIRDDATGRLLRSWPLPGANAASFSPDGRIVAGANSNGDVRAWDVDTGAQVFNVQAGRILTRALCFLPDPLRLATGSQDGAIRIWDVRSSKPLFVLLALSGEHAATIEPDGLLRVNDPKAEDELVYLVREKEDGPVRTLTPAEFRALAEHAKGNANSASTRSGSLPASSPLKPEAHSRSDMAGGPAAAPAGQYDEQFPGFVPAPTPVPGIHRWQVAGRFPGGRFTDLAWSPDGTKVVVCGHDQLLRIYDAETLRLLHAWPFPWVMSVTWSGDGRWIAAGSMTGAVGLWSANDGSPQPAPAALPGGAYVISLAFSPDSRTLAVAPRFRNELRLWDVVHRKPGPMLAHPDVLYDVCWSPDGKSLVTACTDKRVRVWDVSKAEVLRTFEGHTGPVASVAFTDEGQRVISSADDRCIRVWNLARGEQERTWNFSPNTATARTSVATSKDGIVAYVALGDPDIYLRSVDDGAPRPVLGGRTGHRYQFHFPHALKFRFDGARLASINEDASLRIWDVKAGVLVGSVESHSPSLKALASDSAGTMLATGTDRGDAARVWNASDGRLRMTLSGRPSRAVQGVAFSPDGHTIAIGCGANPLYLRGEAEPNSARLFAVDGTPGRIFSDLTGAITTLAFLSDGRRLATGGQGSPLQIWDRGTGALLRTIPTPEWAELIAFSPDGRRFAQLFWPDGLRLWDVETGAALPERRAGAGELMDAVVWHPDGKTIATAEHGNPYTGIRIRDAANGDLRFTMPLADSVAVAMNSDGRLVAGGNEQGDVRVWDARDGIPLLSLHAGRARVRSLSFLSNPLRLAAGTDDGAVRIWDATTGAPLFVLLALSGEHAATIEPDGHVRVNDPKAEDELVYLVREKEDGPVRTLTPAEFRALAEHANTQRPATPSGAESNHPEAGRPPQ